MALSVRLRRLQRDGLIGDVVADAFAKHANRDGARSRAPAPAAAARPSATDRASAGRRRFEVASVAASAIAAMARAQVAVQHSACGRHHHAVSFEPQCLQKRASTSLILSARGARVTPLVRLGRSRRLARRTAARRVWSPAPIPRLPRRLPSSCFNRRRDSRSPASSWRISPIARARSRPHISSKSLCDNLPHRKVELELLDRPQHQRLLTLQRGARRGRRAAAAPRSLRARPAATSAR